jgi:sensor histidine kinase YesM
VTFKVNGQINEMFTTSIMLKEMKSDMAEFESNLELYLASKSSDNFVQYLDYYTQLSDVVDMVENEASPYAKSLQMNNISKLLTSYLEISEKAIEYKRGRNTEAYLTAYSDLLKISGFIDMKVAHLEEVDFGVNLENYQQLTKQFEEIQMNVALIVILLIVLSVLFVFTFSTNVTSPIVELSRQAEDISKGIYRVERVKGNHFKEAELLKDTFYEMASHIQEYISELEDKVDTENKLRVSETEKLKMQNSLNEAELMALQSQINPHFLFNTLNAGMQLAIIEDAERTGRFLEVLSSLFRYNIQSLQNKVTLRDEFDNAQKYYELMRVRFGSQIVFDFELDENAALIEMPPLILQPIIENALIHGFKNKMETGHIQIVASVEGDFVRIEIVDNGEGIKISDLHRLNEGDFRKMSERGGHTTGLGLGNVYERLKHFFSVDHIMHFDSEPKHFTKVVITLPRKDITTC